MSLKVMFLGRSHVGEHFEHTHDNVCTEILKNLGKCGKCCLAFKVGTFPTDLFITDIMEYYGLLRKSRLRFIPVCYGP